jgi:sialic acid synthase SpsE
MEVRKSIIAARLIKKGEMFTEENVGKNNQETVFRR